MTRMLFRCEFCRTLPDDLTQRALQGELLDRRLGRLLDAQPAGWLIWTGGGALGSKRYACRRHREDLTAQLRTHYGAARCGVRQTEPYDAVWPGGWSGFDERELAALLGERSRPVPRRVSAGWPRIEDL